MWTEFRNGRSFEIYPTLIYYKTDTHSQDDSPLKFEMQWPLFLQGFGEQDLKPAKKREKIKKRKFTKVRNKYIPKLNLAAIINFNLNN